MGLSGRKNKQRIPADPRNLSWANDANKFGTSYLQKFGWDPSSGLGASGEGRTRHISVHQKLDMLGIGADHRNSQDGTAWKQGRDFENLLRRLNEAAGKEVDAGEVEAEAMKVDGFVRPASSEETVIRVEEEVDMDIEVAEKKEKKRRKKREREQAEDEEVAGRDGAMERKKLRKSKSSENRSDKEGKRKEKDKKKRKCDIQVDESPGSAKKEEEASTSVVSTSTSVIITEKSKVAVMARPIRAHRARHIAAKGLASKSAAAINEILGISSSSTAFSTPFLTPSAPATPYPPASLTPSTPSTPLDAPAVDLKLQDLTTSSKSVMDYFREKLAAKSRPLSSSGTSVAGLGTPVTAGAMNDYDDRPKGGLGASRLRFETQVPAEEINTVPLEQDNHPQAGAVEGGRQENTAELPKKKGKKDKRKDGGDDETRDSETDTMQNLGSGVAATERKKSKKPKKAKEIRLAVADGTLPGKPIEAGALRKETVVDLPVDGEKTKKSKKKRGKGKQKDVDD